MNVVLPITLTLRRITAADNAAIAAVIRKVSAEYGLTADKGYTVADPNLDELFQVYSQPGAAYWVVEQNGEVVGGGGVAPLGCSGHLRTAKDVLPVERTRSGAGEKAGADGPRTCP